MSSLQHVQRLLDEAAGGSQEALDHLVPLVYDDLRQVAHHALRRTAGPGSLHTTALVHEAYLNLHHQDRTAWQGASHVIGIAATAMRRILVNRSEAARRLKRSGAHAHVDLDGIQPGTEDVDAELLEIDEALERLARVDPRKARLVELRFFAGLSLQESARALDVSLNTAKRDWAVAKLWILRDVERGRQLGA